MVSHNLEGWCTRNHCIVLSCLSIVQPCIKLLTIGKQIFLNTLFFINSVLFTGHWLPTTCLIYLLQAVFGNTFYNNLSPDVSTVWSICFCRSVPGNSYFSHSTEQWENPIIIINVKLELSHVWGPRLGESNRITWAVSGNHKPTFCTGCSTCFHKLLFCFCRSSYTCLMSTHTTVYYMSSLNLSTVSPKVRSFFYRLVVIFFQMAIEALIFATLRCGTELLYYLVR